MVYSAKKKRPANNIKFIMFGARAPFISETINVITFCGLSFDLFFLALVL